MKMSWRWRAASVLAGAAVLAGGAVVTGVDAAPAQAGVACAAGYVCLFDENNNSHGRERAFQYQILDYTPWQWGTYTGGWHLIPGTSIDNEMNALNYNWQIDGIEFFYGYNGQGGSITTYVVANNTGGYRQWSLSNQNRASSHKYYYGS